MSTTEQMALRVGEQNQRNLRAIHTVKTCLVCFAWFDSSGTARSDIVASYLLLIAPLTDIVGGQNVPLIRSSWIQVQLNWPLRTKRYCARGRG